MRERGPWPYAAFTRYGVELEYIIVDAATLEVRPVADLVLKGTGKRPKDEVRHGKLSWSNELVLHVLELKTATPAPQLEPLAGQFQAGVGEVEATLAPLGCRLLPGGVHPWMDPLTETRLWPHGNREIYATFDRIFNCQGHGWSNLQSCHLNLPFSDDAQFRRLHTAIRLALPLLPALAASSPYLEGRATGILDNRLHAYRSNCARVPSVTAQVVPELVESPEAYDRDILERIHRDMAFHDPQGILAHEWVNARGAIARFLRGTIEVRVLDTQECPRMDLAIVQFLVTLVRALYEERLSPFLAQVAPSTEALAAVYHEAVRVGEQAGLPDATLAQALGLSSTPSTLGALLQELWARLALSGADWQADFERLLQHGPLARRLLASAGNEPSRERLRELYRELAECLRQGRMFQP